MKRKDPNVVPVSGRRVCRVCLSHIYLYTSHSQSNNQSSEGTHVWLKQGLHTNTNADTYSAHSQLGHAVSDLWPCQCMAIAMSLLLLGKAQYLWGKSDLLFRVNFKPRAQSSCRNSHAFDVTLLYRVVVWGEEPGRWFSDYSGFLLPPPAFFLDPIKWAGQL